VIRRFVVDVQARTAPLADRAAHAAAEVLGQHYVGPNVDMAINDQWAARCEHILFVADDVSTGRFVRNADQVMLTPAAADRLRAGTLSEAAFDDAAVLGDAEVDALPPGSTVTLYLAGMREEAPGTPLGHQTAAALRECRRESLARWRARGLPIVMLLCAATPAGRILAERSGGQCIGTTAERADGYDLYELTELAPESDLRRGRAQSAPSRGAAVALPV
jgi:hypothetical protein